MGILGYIFTVNEGRRGYPCEDVPGKVLLSIVSMFLKVSSCYK